MSRIDDLGKILDSYEGRDHWYHASLPPEKIFRALNAIMSVRAVSVLKPLDAEAADLAARAYYAALQWKDHIVDGRNTVVKRFCEDFTDYLRRRPDNIKTFCREALELIEEQRWEDWTDLMR